MGGPVVRSWRRPKWYVGFEMACITVTVAFCAGLFVGHWLAELENWLCCH